jgi:hypothetical protein
MKPARRCRWFLCLCGWLLLPVVMRAAAPAAAFVQRVDLVDFHLLEKNSDLELSPTSQLVICFANIERAGAVDRAVALRRAAGEKWRLSYLAATPAQEPGQFRRDEAELDPVIARNVLAIVNHLLGSNVKVETKVLHQSSADDDAWIFVRGDQAVATGVASNRVLQRSRGEDAAIYRDLCAGLFGIFVAPDERDRVIKQLDRLTVRYVELKKLRRG